MLISAENSPTQSTLAFPIRKVSMAKSFITPSLTFVGNWTGPLRPLVSDNTASAASYHLIRKWLDENMQKQPSSIPSRLIDVAEFPTTGKVTLRSKSKNQMDDADTRYLALSHVWGLQHFLTLLTTNLESFEEGIDVSSLTNTFQDMIRLCSDLGFRYVWIDSLCIIQNSDDDWNYEATRMADVYLHATCTIVALAAWGGSEGMFRPQTKLNISPCHVGFMRQGKSLAPIYAIPDGRKDRLIREVEVNMSKWHTRGWCLQERKCTCRPSESSTDAHRLSLFKHYLFRRRSAISWSRDSVADWQGLIGCGIAIR
jgi:hypothetical protein